MKRAATFAAALVALAASGSLRAHHSGGMFETAPIWVRGTVVRFERVNPHTVTILEERSGDGQVHRWRVEGPGEWQLERMGIDMDVPKVGEVLEVCGFPYKEQYANPRLADSDGSPMTSVAGHVLVTADAKKRFWEPHGRISECIRRAPDSRQSWVDFLNADSRAAQAWCEQRRMESVRSDPALTQLVGEIDGLLVRPCR